MVPTFNMMPIAIDAQDCWTACKLSYMKKRRVPGRYGRGCWLSI